VETTHFILQRGQYTQRESKSPINVCSTYHLVAIIYFGGMRPLMFSRGHHAGVDMRMSVKTACAVYSAGGGGTSEGTLASSSKTINGSGSASLTRGTTRKRQTNMNLGHLPETSLEAAALPIGLIRTPALDTLIALLLV
jgi:hypothetical protein